MIKSALYSLRWRLIIRLALLQGLALLVIVSAVIALMWREGWVPDTNIVPTIAASIRHDGGRLTLNQTKEFRSLQRRYPDLWFYVDDTQGRQLRYGDMPAPYVDNGERRTERDLPFGRMEIWNSDVKGAPEAFFRRINYEGGTLQVLAGVKAKSDATNLLYAILWVSLIFTLPLVILSTLVLVVATSFVVRGSFRHLEGIAGQAQQITISDRGVRLPNAVGPTEVQPLIIAVNAALDRMDEGYARRARFLADAAHELRTPIAILQTRLDGMERSDDLQRLRQDVARLAIMAEQMLDLQRLDGSTRPFERVDLVHICRNAVSDMAPFVKASGADLSLDLEVVTAPIMGDASALERAVANLIHNAVEHGGAEIAVRVQALALEVSDNGVGIPEDEREKVFEPFYRRTHRATGAGLGLSLVQQVAKIHGGRAMARVSVAGGAAMRIEFPARAA